MRQVYLKNEDDHDVMALFAEAMMTRTPWQLWDVRKGVPAANADTLEIIEVIQRSIALKDAAGEVQHPAILHFHIHATEMSDQPEQAMRSADILGTLFYRSFFGNQLRAGSPAMGATVASAMFLIILLGVLVYTFAWQRRVTTYEL